MEENVVKFWQPASGLFGALVGAFGSVGMPGSGLGGAHNSPGLLTLKMFRSFNIGPARGMINCLLYRIRIISQNLCLFRISSKRSNLNGEVIVSSRSKDFKITYLHSRFKYIPIYMILITIFVQ